MIRFVILTACLAIVAISTSNFASAATRQEALNAKANAELEGAIAWDMEGQCRYIDSQDRGNEAWTMYATWTGTGAQHTPIVSALNAGDGYDDDGNEDLGTGWYWLGVADTFMGNGTDWIAAGDAATDPQEKSAAYYNAIDSFDAAATEYDIITGILFDAKNHFNAAINSYQQAINLMSQ